MTLSSKNKKHTYFCMPIALSLPVIFAAMAAFCYFTAYIYWENNHDLSRSLSFVLFGLLSLVMTICLTPTTVGRVEIHNDIILYKGLLPHSKFELEYAKCNVGMDYHKQGNRTIWWIYLCEGPVPQYNTQNSANRINAVKIRPGFIKIMYSADIYRVLMEVLPEPQKNALKTAHCSEYSKD